MTTTWISNSGETACLAHGGSYLREAVRRNPTARVHVTPLTTWTPSTLPCDACGLRALCCESGNRRWGSL